MDKSHHGCPEEDRNPESVLLKGKSKSKKWNCVLLLNCLVSGFFCVIFYFWMRLTKTENDIAMFCCLKNSRLLFDVGIIILSKKWVAKFLQKK